MFATVFNVTRNTHFRDTLFGYIRADAPLYLAIVAYTAVGLSWLHFTQLSHLTTYSVYLMKWLTLFAFLFPAIAVAMHALRLVHRFDRRRRLAARRIFSPAHAARFLAGVCLLLAMVLFQGTFTSLKNSLPAWWGGFPGDRLQADVDAALHFGVDPWRLLFTFAERDWVRAVVEWNYNVLWFVVCFGALFYVVTSQRTAAIRTRYLVCFMLVWIVIGNLLAGAFLSAGPAYYGYVTGDTGRFAAQLAFLAAGSEWGSSAASYQAYLWRLHEAGGVGFGSGISAFPSVHVGLIAMNALFVFERHRWLGMAAFAYVTLVLASSVYLAWHYAIDGYAAIAVTVMLFVGVRKWLPARSPGQARHARFQPGVAGGALR